MEKDNAKHREWILELKKHHEVLNEKIERIERNPNLHARPEELSELKKQKLSIKDILVNNITKELKKELSSANKKIRDGELH